MLLERLSFFVSTPDALAKAAAETAQAYLAAAPPPEPEAVAPPPPIAQPAAATCPRCGSPLKPAARFCEHVRRADGSSATPCPAGLPAVRQPHQGRLRTGRGEVLRGVRRRASEPLLRLWRTALVGREVLRGVRCHAGGGRRCPPFAVQAAGAVTPSGSSGTRRKTQPPVEVATAKQPADISPVGVVPPVQRSTADGKTHRPRTTPTSPPAASRQPLWLRTLFLMITNPGHFVAEGMSTVSWPFALLVSGGAFLLFCDRLDSHFSREGGQRPDRRVLRRRGRGVRHSRHCAAGLVAGLPTCLLGGSKPVGWVIRALASGSARRWSTRRSGCSSTSSWAGILPWPSG